MITWEVKGLLSAVELVDPSSNHVGCSVTVKLKVTEWNAASINLDGSGLVYCDNLDYESQVDYFWCDDHNVKISVPNWEWQ